MLDQLDADFAFNREALDVRATRQALLSSNIANADTPGYLARDVDFSSSLAGALRQAGAMGPAGVGMENTAANDVPLTLSQPAGVTSTMGLATTEPGQMAGDVKLIPTGGEAEAYTSPVEYQVPTQPSLDGNTVDLDVERVQFANNALHYESSMTEVSGQIKTMMDAITSGGT
ncbi:flagellar basal body rod protein FlgB [Burkholderia sp. WAC0059]|uniref:flagellar basal body protein n=1 Tax=Burkholderia sp. WAC0059 TaxID=2066022 RepID=UPI000C7F5770|nr:flagellar basal body protein [Burkholderia sp. WAC0059]PLZ00658.1 flagellar basal body rod protein FlgB [Burkholderia sp. WAC0059]